MISDLYESGWTVKRFTEAPDAGGAITVTWADHLTISARIRQLSAREVTVRDKDEAVSDLRVYTDKADITIKDRLVDPDGKVYNITAVDNPHQLDEFLQLDVIRTDVEAEDDA